jgi:hypothetical protein
MKQTPQPESRRKRLGNASGRLSHVRAATSIPDVARAGPRLRNGSKEA